MSFLRGVEVRLLWIPPYRSPGIFTREINESRIVCLSLVICLSKNSEVSVSCELTELWDLYTITDAS